MMSWKTYRLLLVGVLMGWMPLAHAQIDPLATATTDRDSILIGEVVTMTLTIEYDYQLDTSQVKWPTEQDSLAPYIELIDTEPRQRQAGISGNSIIEQQEWHITSYDSGYFKLDPMQFAAGEDTFYSEPIYIYASYVPLDLQDGIKDIKDILEVNLTFWERWGSAILWTGGFILLFLALYWGYQKLPKRTKEVKPKVQTRTLLLHERMIKRLEQLDQRQLWQQGHIKQFYVESTQILREYVELRYTINARELTSDQLIKQLRYKDIDYESNRKLQHLLWLSDMVKFAKEEPLYSENESAIREAIEFIHNTRNTERRILDIPEQR